MPALILQGNMGLNRLIKTITVVDFQFSFAIQPPSIEERTDTITYRLANLDTKAIKCKSIFLIEG